jgi:cytochrome b
MSTKKVLVWDVPVRLVHWLLVASFAGAFLTGESERLRLVHMLFGTTLAGLVVFRLVWGIVGTRHARFASFAFGPRAVLRYLRSLATLKPVRYVGHTPAGSWAIWLMLGLGLAVGATGYGAYAGGAEWLEDAHGALAWTLLAIVVVHVAGVALGSVLHRENLVVAMLTGRKRGDAADAIPRSRWLVGAAVAALVLALWLDVVSIPGLPMRPSVAKGVDGSHATVHQEDD